jgi:hypothetical protein
MFWIGALVGLFIGTSFGALLVASFALKRPLP